MTEVVINYAVLTKEPGSKYLLRDNEFVLTGYRCVTPS